MLQCLVLLVSLNCFAEDPITSLDSDFFKSPLAAPTGRPNRDNGVTSLDADFFASKNGLLENSEAGEFGCTAIWGAKTPRGEAASIGSIAKAYCSDRPAIKWVPMPTAWKKSTDPEGYYQVCCSRNGSIARAPIRRLTP